MERIKLNIPQLPQIQMGALAAGGGGLLVCAMLAAIPATRVGTFQAYLFAYVFALSIALGSLGILMVQHVAGGRWGFVSRRIMEAAIGTIPYMAVLFIPILLGMGVLYPWMPGGELASNELVVNKAPYLNPGFFIVRAIIYFAVWGGLAYVLQSWSLQQDDTNDPKLTDRMKLVSSFGLVLFVLTTTFAAFDWTMSLEPKWFSSIYGVKYFTGGVLTAFAFIILVAFGLRENQPDLKAWFSTDSLSDLGNFLLGFVCFWAYIEFSQYLILYQANLPETVTWYLYRSTGGWQYLIILVIMLQFVVPFLALVNRRTKRNPQILAGIAALVLVMRPLDLIWIIIPSFYPGTDPGGASVPWQILPALAATVGAWAWLFIWQFKNKPVIPVNDAKFKEVPAHG